MKRAGPASGMSTFFRQTSNRARSVRGRANTLPRLQRAVFAGFALRMDRCNLLTVLRVTVATHLASIRGRNTATHAPPVWRTLALVVPFVPAARNVLARRWRVAEFSSRYTSGSATFWLHRSCRSPSRSPHQSGLCRPLPRDRDSQRMSIFDTIRLERSRMGALVTGSGTAINSVHFEHVRQCVHCISCHRVYIVAHAA